MRYSFLVEVEVNRTEGKFATWEELEEQLREVLDTANPSELTGDNEGTYEISEWEVISQGKPKLTPKVSPGGVAP